MNRNEYYQARHDFRSELSDLFQKYEHGTLKYKLGMDRIWNVTPSIITTSLQPVKFWTSSMKPWRGSSMPYARWHGRCSLVPNSYPRETRNP